MAKIAYNNSYGGFGLSDEAVKYYAKLANKNIKAVGHSFKQHWELDDEYWDEYSIDRDDPHLIATIEALGERASGQNAEVRIRELPAGTEYVITNYDGIEHVVTKDEFNWRIA